jgi:hypothetical protein
LASRRWGQRRAGANLRHWLGFNERLRLFWHEGSMTEEQRKKVSSWKDVGLCLLHVGVIFVPIAFCMLLLAGISMQKTATSKIDPIETGTVQAR